jgi:hypothetical protein
VLRSLFIGFLILSTLTSKGVGVQINQNAALSADMLLNLYNAAVAYADRQAEFSAAKREGPLLRTTETTLVILRDVLRSARYDGNLAWDLPTAPDTCRSNCYETCGRLTESSCEGAIYACGSDTSPPCRS